MIRIIRTSVLNSARIIVLTELCMKTAGLQMTSKLTFRGKPPPSLVTPLCMLPETRTVPEFGCRKTGTVIVGRPPSNECRVHRSELSLICVTLPR